MLLYEDYYYGDVLYNGVII